MYKVNVYDDVVICNFSLWCQFASLRPQFSYLVVLMLSVCSVTYCFLCVAALAYSRRGVIHIQGKVKEKINHDY